VQPVTAAPGDDWQGKYQVLQGKYNTEVPALHKALAEANGTINHLNGIVQNISMRVQQLEAAPPVAPTPAPAPVLPQFTPPAAAPESPALPSLDPELFEGYGNEMVDMVKLVNTQAEYIESLRAQMGQVGERVELSAKDTFYAQLDQVIPGWEYANTDPSYIQWLQHPDPFAGIARQQLLTNAFEALDAQRVARFFLAWKQEAGIQGDFQPPSGALQPITPMTTSAPVTPMVSAQSTAQPNPAYTVAQPIVPISGGMAGMVMPSSVAGHDASPTQIEVPLVTRQQYQQAVNDFLQKRIPEAEYNAIATNFQKCIAAGKVV
jgi:hypothetical protein